MPKKTDTFILTVALHLVAVFATAQHFSAEFKTLRMQNDTAAQAVLLAKWQAAAPQDPEMFIAWLNFYVQKSQVEILFVDKNRNNDMSLPVKDSTGKQAGYISSTEKFNPAIVQMGFEYINKGIALYPNRLDMRFGKIYMLGQMEEYREFTNQIKIMIDYDGGNPSKWTWTENKPIDHPKDFFIGAIQEYIIQVYNLGDGYLPLMREIAESVLKYYPDNVECLSDAALTYEINGSYDTALTYLMKAETIAPKDVIVLNKIAEAFHRKHDKENATLYYKKIIKYGSSGESEDARQKMKKLD